MRTYPRGFELRKWFRARRCARCRDVFEAGPSAKYCAPCSTAILEHVLPDAPAAAITVTIDRPILQRVDAHFVWVDAMARDPHGRAMLSLG